MLPSHLKYFNVLTYDAMGNILTQVRHNSNGDPIDNLSYVYHTIGGKLVRNRLYHLDDTVNDGAHADDIDDMGSFVPGANMETHNNYSYDEEGRLIKDSKEGISKIVWRVDGKVKEIQRMTGSTKWLKFDYDAMGNRIAKHVFSNNGTTLERSTYYILDAQGNQISTYDHEIISETTQFNLKENNIYGSSRIGNLNRNVNVLTSTISSNYASVLGGKYYEFSNHLGNVLNVFSDLKIPKDADNNNVVDEYEIGMVSTADYSPFGVELDGRTESSWEYRYGYQGSEKDDEMKGEGNSYTTEFRQYDPRLGRWLSPDPLASLEPAWTTYRFCFNNPLIYTDEDGLYETFREALQARRGARDAGFKAGKIQGKKGEYWFQGSDKEGTVIGFKTKKFDIKPGKYKGGIEFYDAADAKGAIPPAQERGQEAFKIGGYTVVPSYIGGKLDHYTACIKVIDQSTMKETYRYDFVIGRDKIDHFEEYITNYAGAANLAFGANLHLEQYQIDLANGNYNSAIGGRLRQEWTNVESILDALTSLPVKKPTLRSSNFKSSLRNASPQQQKQIRRKTKKRLKKG
jgi:RHS repeat-associated protein